MDIQIKNESAALGNCETLNKLANSMEQEVATLESHLAKIKSGWSSNGMDKESYVLELEKQIRNLRTITDSTKKLAATLSNYITNTQSISNLSVGDSIAGHNITTGYVNAYNAVNNQNSVNLNTKYVNDTSSIRGFAVIGENGAVVDRSYATGTTLQEFAKANNVSIDRVAVDVGSQDGTGLAWVSVDSFK